MKLLLSLLLSIPAFANFPNQVAVALEAGKATVRFTNNGSSGGILDKSLGTAPAGWSRIGVAVTPGEFVPPTASTTFTTCADPCGTGGTASLTTLNMQWGEPYIWEVRLDSDGSVHSPFTYSGGAPAFKTGRCGGIGTLPLIEPAAVTTSPLPMPRRVILQDCGIDRYTLPLLAGHATTGVQLYIQCHACAYSTISQSDHKFSVQINGGAWIDGTNANTAIHRIDETRYFSRNDLNQFNIDATVGFRNFGGYVKDGKYLIDIPDGTISSGDTSVQIAFRFNGTDSVTSGFTIIAAFLVEGTHCQFTAATITSGVMTATCNSHGYSTNDNVFVWGGSGSWYIVNGMHASILRLTADTFSYTPCEAAPGTPNYSTGGSKIGYCSPIDGDYMPPYSRDPQPGFSSTNAQAYMYSARMLTASSAFTYIDPSTWTAPGTGDPVRGKTLFETADLVLPVTPATAYSSSVHCNDCHAHGPSDYAGSDLKYFNFSNESIGQRCYFHGLSTQDGIDIAAYIRGIHVPVPVQARPWNPPMQTGPGMSAGSFYRTPPDGGSATLTSIVLAGCAGSPSICTATATTVPDHGYATGMWITVPIDTTNTVPTAGSLGGNVYTITVTGAKTFTFQTSGVSSGTYNNAGLFITNAHDFMAGCGIDCVSTYGYPRDMLPSLGSPTNWTWDKHVDPRNIVYPYPFADWNAAWLPSIHPLDSTPSADFANSTPNQFLLSTYAALTPGNFPSYKAGNYVGGLGSSNLWGKTLTYVSTDSTQVQNSPPDSTNKFQVLENLPYPPNTFIFPGNLAPSDYNRYRLSTIQTSIMGLWTLQVNYKLGGFSVPMIKDIYDVAAPAADWSFVNSGMVFNYSYHKMTMAHNNCIDATLSCWIYDSAIWYVNSPGIAARGYYGCANDYIDDPYYQAYNDNLGAYRVNGLVVHLLPSILSLQAGNNWADLFHHFSLCGMDWTGLAFNSHFGWAARSLGTWWYSKVELATLSSNLADMYIALLTSRTHTYWEDTLNNYAGSNAGAIICSNKNGSWGGGGSVCNDIATDITFMRLFSFGDPSQTAAIKTKLDTIVAYVKTIILPEWDTFKAAGSWDYAITAASEGDHATDGWTGSLATAQPISGNVITFPSGSCPKTDSTRSVIPLKITSTGGGETNEYLYGYRGTCAANAQGGAGTLAFFTTQNHTGTVTLTFGITSDGVPNGTTNNNSGQLWFVSPAFVD